MTTTSTHTHPSVGDTFVDGYGGTVQIRAIVEGWGVLMRQGHPQPFFMHCDHLMSDPRWQLRCKICRLPREEKQDETIES